jgi:hypothetical protein
MILLKSFYRLPFEFDRSECQMDPRIRTLKTCVHSGEKQREGED